MNNGVIKMFLAAWRNANDISAGKEEEEKKERMKKGGSGAASMRERRVEKGVGGSGGGGVTKQKMKRDKKELELEEVRPITGCSVAFKDAWDRWPLQTISLHRAASSPEEIRDSSIPPSTHAPRLLCAPLFSPPPPTLPSWGISQPEVL